MQFKISDQKNEKDSLHFNFGNKEISGNLTIHYFVDHGHHICYVPSLQLTSYGDSKEEAFNRFINEVLEEYFKILFNLDKGLIDAELKKVGFTRNKFFTKRFLSNTFIDKDGILRDFNLPKETIIETSALAA